jgi:hypothetical protein
MTWIAKPIAPALASLVLLLAIMPQFCACSMLDDTRNPTICFVLPDGYRGVFQLVLDEKQGVDVIHREGKYVYEIPVSGVLKIKSFKPFDGWHKEIAVYKSGESIPTEDSTIAPNTVALRLLGTSSHNKGPLAQTNVIGTEEQAKQAKIDEMAGKLNSVALDSSSPFARPESR